MKRLTSNLVLAACLLTTWARPAHADAESWNALEVRIPTESDAVWKPTSLRVVTSSRFGSRYPGLGVSNLRLGPLFQLAPWLMLGLHGSAYAEQTACGKPIIF